MFKKAYEQRNFLLCFPLTWTLMLINTTCVQELHIYRSVESSHNIISISCLLVLNEDNVTLQTITPLFEKRHLQYHVTYSTSCNMDISGDHMCTRLHSSKTLLMGWFLIVPLVLYPRPFIRLLGQGKFSWPVYGLYFSTPVQIFCCFLFTAVIIDNDPMTIMLTGRFNDVMGYCHFCRLWGQSMNVLITGTCIQVRC